MIGDDRFPPRITAYDADTFRIRRLEQTVAFACGMVTARPNMSSALMLDGLIRVHDHKGLLSCLWRSQEHAECFGEFLGEGWEWVGELSEMCQHFALGGLSEGCSFDEPMFLFLGGHGQYPGAKEIDNPFLTFT